MDFELDPPTGVGPLLLGMPQQSASTVLDSLRDPSALSDSDRPGQHVFRPSGLMISVHCTRGVLEAIELGRPTAETDRVTFRGLDLFSSPARKVVEVLRGHTEVDEDPDDPASFIAPNLQMSFWRPFEADGEPEEEQGYYFSSVLIAQPGYYDTPVEAEERLRRPS